MVSTINSTMDSLKAKYDGLSRVHRRIATWLLDHPTKALELNLDEMAAATGSSRSTILRFCQAIDVDGFKGLKKMLAQPVGRSLQYVDEDDVLRWVRVGTEATVRDTFAQLLPDVFQEAAAQCARARHIVWFGSLESGYMALGAAHKCSMLGINSQAYSEYRSLQSNIRFITAKDVLAVISWGGDGHHIRRPVMEAQEQGIPIIALTAHPLSWLAEAADWTLAVGNQYATHDGRQITLRAGQEALTNALIFKVASLRGIQWQISQ